MKPESWLKVDIVEHRLLLMPSLPTESMLGLSEEKEAVREWTMHSESPLLATEGGRE